MRRQRRNRNDDRRRRRRRPPSRRRHRARSGPHGHEPVSNTSDIARRAQQGEARRRLFADNTLGAVRQGAEHALAALIERAFATLAEEVRETPALIVTGGASSRVEGLLRSPFSVVPDLVLQGLAVLAMESG